MPVVSIKDIKVSYELHHSLTRRASGTSTSSNPLIVLINGLADTKETWAGQLPAFLGAGYNVFVYDNRGVGASSRPEGRWTSDDMATDLKELVTSLNLPTPFHLLGVSMGGMIAQTYALYYPEDVQSLILACTYAAPGPFCSRMFDYWSGLSQKTDVATVMGDVLLWAFTPDFFEIRRLEDIQEAEATARDIDLSTEEYLSQLNVIQTFDSTRNLGKLADINVLVVAGEQDILIPVSLSQKLHRSIPGSEWSTVKGGHACLWEFPDSFNATVIRYIETLDRLR